MSFLAAAHRSIDATPDAVLAKLRDFSSWSSWMPQSFVPVSGPSRPLEVGDRFRVRIAGVPGVAALRFERYEPGRSIAWSGGAPGMLEGFHVFRVEAREGGSIVHSEETWSGLLSHVGPLAKLVQARAERVGEDQLAGLASALASAKSG